jgi:Leucine-rich repeat (LRR) protein
VLEQSAVPSQVFWYCNAGCPAVGKDLRGLQECTVLRTLHLDGCCIHQIPSFLTSLQHLSVLGVGNNAIHVVPVDVSRLQRLTALDLRNNSISALPPELSLVPLRSLLLEGNMLRTIKRSTLDRGTPAVLEHLKSRLPISPANI